MGTTIRQGLGVDVSSSPYWTPQSLVVQNATPTHVDITFPSAKTVGAGDFTISGFTVNSGSWTGVVYTLVLSTSVVITDSLIVVYKTKSYPVTNNVAGVEITDGNILKMFSDGITGGYISGQNLSGFNDLSGSGNNGAKVVVSTDVKLITNGFGTHKVVRFAGTDCNYFNFTELTNVRSFIWIGLENTAADGVLSPLFGSDATYYQLSRMSATDPLTAAAINARGIFQFVNGGINTALYKCVRQAVRLNGKCISAHGTDIPTTMSILSGTFSENVRCNNLAMDRVTSRIFAGDVILFKLYNKVLSDAELRNEISYWGVTLGITTDFKGHHAKLHNEGDSFAAAFSTNLNNGSIEGAGNFALTSVVTDSAVAGSKVEDLITRSDNNTIPNTPYTDMMIQVGINDVHAYYANSAAQQRADFAARIESFYTKIKAKQAFTKLFWGNVPEVYVPNISVPTHQAWVDAVPFHYIYNEELAALAVRHPEVYIIDVKSVMDGVTAANYSADGLHPSTVGYAAILALYQSTINTAYA
jgi:lysophospholipase L1-like esterase